MRSKGFNENFPVPVNRQYTILGGAHRTACASVLGIDVLIDFHDTDNSWPAWGREWFETHGMAQELPWMEAAFKNGPPARQSNADDLILHKGTSAGGSALLMGTENA